jgi:hypothetical protein
MGKWKIRQDSAASCEKEEQAKNSLRLPFRSQPKPGMFNIRISIKTSSGDCLTMKESSLHLVQTTDRDYEKNL